MLGTVNQASGIVERSNWPLSTAMKASGMSLRFATVPALPQSHRQLLQRPALPLTQSRRQQRRARQQLRVAASAGGDEDAMKVTYLTFVEAGFQQRLVRPHYVQNTVCPIYPYVDFSWQPHAIMKAIGRFIGCYILENTVQIADMHLDVAVQESRQPYREGAESMR